MLLMLEMVIMGLSVASDAVVNDEKCLLVEQEKNFIKLMAQLILVIHTSHSASVKFFQ